MDDQRTSYACTIDDAAHTLTLASNDKAKAPDLVVHYARTDADHLELSVDIDGKPNTIGVSVVPRSSFLVNNRGFRWHQEFPFNR